MAIKFEITGDNSNLLRSLNGAREGVARASREIEQSGLGVEDMFKRVGAAASVALAGFSATNFVKEVARVRGEFQQLEVAFNTMLGNQAEAQTLMNQLVRTAAITPFDLHGVAEGAKQLLAYGTAANEVNGTLVRLGDIAAGLSIPLGDLVYLYGTTMVQGKMNTQDLKQFLGRGIPMAKELAKQFGVAESQVAGLVTAGKVSAEHVEKAIISMTSAGSKFGGLMEAQSKTISGQISNIEDAIDVMYNEIGKKNEGVINTVLEGVSTLVENYEAVGTVILGLVGAYGAYKAALMATIAVENSMRKYKAGKEIELLDEEIRATQALLPAKKASANADLEEAVAKRELTAAQAELIAAKRAELEATKQSAAANEMLTPLNAEIEAMQELLAVKEESKNADLDAAVAGRTLSQSLADEVAARREVLAQLTEQVEARKLSLQGTLDAEKAELAAASERLEIAQETHTQSIVDLNAAQQAKNIADEKVKAAQEYLDAQKAIADYQDAQNEYDIEGYAQLQAALAEQKAAANELATISEQENAAAVALNSAEQEVNTVAKKVNTTQTQLDTLAEGTNTAATTANTTAQTTNTAATTTNTIATRLNAISTKAAAAAQAVFAAAVNSVKNAWNSMKVAMMTNPIGAIIGAVTIAISLFYAFADAEDEAATSMKKYGEAADVASSKVETLYATIQANAGKTTKVQKDAMEELSRMAADYGIVLDKEKDLYDQLIDKKKELIGLIREESIERQRANDLEAANERYKTNSDEIKKKAKEALEGVLSEFETSQLFNLFDTQMLTEYQRAQDELERLSQKFQKKRASGVEISNEEYKKSEQLRNKINANFAEMEKVVNSYTQSLGKNKDEQKQVLYTISGKLSEMGKERIALEESTAAIDRTADAAANAARATDGMTEAQRALAEKTKMSNMEVKDLDSAINSLISEYNNANINLQISYEELNTPPEWMDGVAKRMSSEQLKNLAAFHASRAKQMREHKKTTGRDLVMKNSDGSYYDEKQATIRAYQYSKKAVGKKSDEDRAAAEADANKKKAEAEAKKQRQKADQLRREERRAEQDKRKIDDARLEAAKELEEKISEARLEAMTDGAEKVRLLREREHKEELDAIEKQRKDAIQTYIDEERRLFEQQEKIKKTKNENYTEREFDEKSVNTSAISARYDELLQITKSKQLKDAQKEALDAMREFLKEYGSFEQQRLATTEEYADKIAKATTEGERLSLRKERERKLASLIYENIAAGIDWHALFSGVGSISKEMMKPMFDQLMAYTKTDEYRQADAQTQQQVAGLIQELRQYLGTDQSATWQALGQATKDFTAAVGHYNQAVTQEKEAIARLEQAKADLQGGKITQAAFDAVKAEADKLGTATQEARSQMQGFATNLNDTSEQVANFTSKLTVALNNAKGWKGVEGFGEVKHAIAAVDAFKGALDSSLPAMGEGMGKSISKDLSATIGGSLSAMGKGLEGILSSGLGQTIGFVAQIPRLILDLVSSVKNLVVGALEAATELISLRWIDELVVSITDAIGNLVDAIFDLPENLFKVLSNIVVNGIGGLLNGIVGRVANVLTFGLLSSEGPASWFTNSNAKEVAETMERLTERNKLLEQAIEDLTEEMAKTRGVAAIRVSSEAEKLQRETTANYKAIAQAQAGYHSSHHSFNYYWGGFSDEQKKRLSVQMGRQWDGNIWNLSPEEMKMLRSNVDMWKQIQDTGKGGYGGKVAEKLNDYIEQAGKLQEITDKLYENLTTTTRENVFDGFLSQLYDVGNGAEDVFTKMAEDWQTMVNKMVINNLVGANFQKKLDKWYEDLAKLNESRTNGEITDAEYKRRLDALKNGYEGYVKDAQRDIESLRSAGIIQATDKDTYSQKATATAWQSMSQETAGELNGRFTALQIAGENISSQVVSIYGQMMAMTSLQTSSNNSLLEIRNMMITANSYLEDMVRYAKRTYLDFGEKLDSIATNTKRI